MNKLLTTFAAAVLPLVGTAQTFDFDLTKPQPVYTIENGAGYDLLPAPTKQNPTEPWYFSVRVPDGNYRVTIVLGGKRAGETTVRAEGRRLLAENVVTRFATPPLTDTT